MFASLQIESFDAIYFYKSDNNSLEQLRYMTRVINSETNVAAKVRLWEFLNVISLMVSR